MVFFFMFGKIGFKSFGKFTAGEQDAPPAAFTFESNVRAETRDGPLIGTAWMLFAKSQVIVEMKVGKHIDFR